MNLKQVLLFICSFTFLQLNAQVGLVANDITFIPLLKKEKVPALNQVLHASELVNSKKPTSLIEIPKAYHYDNLAFFCKVEVDLEKASKFPIKFRLGDVEYVDRLEGKYPATYKID